MWTPAGRCGKAAQRSAAPCEMEKRVTPWLMSSKRASGTMRKITPLQAATEGSVKPKSVSRDISGPVIGAEW